MYIFFGHTAKYYIFTELYAMKLVESVNVSGDFFNTVVFCYVIHNWP
jgi:hypothetical protein